MEGGELKCDVLEQTGQQVHPEEPPISAAEAAQAVSDKPAEPVSAGSLSRENVDKLKKLNVVNAIKKLKAGKTLSASEVKFLDDQAGVSDRLFDSMAHCSATKEIPMPVMKALKRTDCTAFRAGGRVHEGELDAYMAENGIGNDGSGMEEFAILDADGLESKEAAEARLVRSRADESEFRLLTKKGEYIAKEEVQTVVARLVLSVKTKLLELPDTLAARCALDPRENEISRVIREGICDALSGLAECRWLTVAPAATQPEGETK